MDKKYILKCNFKKVFFIIIFLLLCCIICNFIKPSTNTLNKLIEVSYNVNEKISYPDLISEYTTNFNEQNINRSKNIKLATSKVNGTVILPGEIFSYNTIVGNKTEEAGFKLAPMYISGKVVDGLGGGVCQLSSTLYNASLYADLEIVERKNHQFMPGYIDVGRDATVADEYIDFKIRNNRKYPIKIVCSAVNGILKCQIYGKRGNNEYDIEIQSVITEVIPYETIYQKDVNEKIGSQVIIQNGKNGYKCKVYKITKKNGEILSKVMISDNTYNSMSQIIKIGEKE